MCLVFIINREVLFGSQSWVCSAEICRAMSYDLPMGSHQADTGVVDTVSYFSGYVCKQNKSILFILNNLVS